MDFLADFHVHSKYSRATSPHLDLEHIYIASQLKGITLVGTGDFTHPLWSDEIKTKLEPAEQGLFRLKKDIASQLDPSVPVSCRRPVRYMLSTEISNIYKKDGRTRKNHNLVFFPEIESAHRFSSRLDKIGNIVSDGRPILGLDAHDLLDMVLGVSDKGVLIPAHVWTPWFSLLGSKSGFDTVEECFGDLSDYIFALETGLSSDPPMNWRISDLDRFALVSNSDAHSPSKLGREANRFTTALSYDKLMSALRDKDKKRFWGTLEFYPEHGKYHVDGHRKCHFCSDPLQTRQLEGKCPECSQPLTLGVLYRVEQLADRDAGMIPKTAFNFKRLLPLEDILSELLEVGAKSKKVQHAYRRCVEKAGPELDILYKAPFEIIEKAGIALLWEAIDRMRREQIQFNPGFDGQFGSVRIFSSEEKKNLLGQRLLFDFKEKNRKDAVGSVGKPNEKRPASGKQHRHRKKPIPKSHSIELNPQQQKAVDHTAGPLLITAGPGTGKTRTITCRMVDLITQRNVDADHILAVTFTNKAADEMRRRLEIMLGTNKMLPKVTTFHGLCWEWLKSCDNYENFHIADDSTRNAAIRDAIGLVNAPFPMKADQVEEKIMTIKQHLVDQDHSSELNSTVAIGKAANFIWDVFKKYQDIMRIHRLCDFEDLMCLTVQMLIENEAWRHTISNRFSHIFVDEFQDINTVQYRLLNLLSATVENICVIGDPDQSIYGFRGSDPDVFIHFMEDYPKAKQIFLRHNYRCSKAIVNASQQVMMSGIIKDKDESDTETFTAPECSDRIFQLSCLTARSEAVAIGKEIEKLVGGTGFQAIDFGKVDQSQTTGDYCFGDIAVFYRTRHQADILAETFLSAGIACQWVQQDAAWHQQLKQKVTALLRLASESGTFVDLDHIRDLISPAVSAQTVKRFKFWAYRQQVNVHQALHMARRLPIDVLKTSQQQRINDLIQYIDRITEIVAASTVSDALEKMIENSTLAAAVVSDPYQGGPLSQLMDLAKCFDRRVGAFLDALALQSDTDLYAHQSEKVALMSLHASKGLEFPVVFISGCEQGLIPYRQNGRRCDVDEERRLFYVGMTRAEQRLYLSWAGQRTLFGKAMKQQPSVFIGDIEPHLIQHLTETGERSTVGRQRQLSLF